MAQEIVELTRDPLKHGLVQFTVLYLYELDPPILIDPDGAGKLLILKPSSALPEAVVANGLVHQLWIDALDAGGAYFILDRVEQERGQTLPELLDVVRSRYGKGFREIERERIRWANAGKAYNA